MFIVVFPDLNFMSLYFDFQQQCTSRTHDNILTHSSWRATTEGRYHQSKTCCRGEYNWISRKSNNKNVRSNHLKDTYQLRDFYTRRKIFRIGHWKLLFRNFHGLIRIYENTHQINSTRHYCTSQVKLLS